MKILLITLLMAVAGMAQAQSIDKLFSDMMDVKLSALGKDTVLHVGKGIILDTTDGKATVRIDSAYVAKIAKAIPIDGYALFVMLKAVPPVTTAQRNLLKAKEGDVIWNKSIGAYQMFTGGKWQ